MTKKVLITGASGGIGLKLVEEFLEKGWFVYAHYNQNLKNLSKIKSKNLNTIKADLKSEPQIKNLFKKIKSLDSLVLNAGIYESKSIPFYEMNLKQWNETLNVNLTANFLLTKEFGKNILKYKTLSPSIVLISSTAGTIGEAFHLDYATSKGALISGFLKTIKNEITKIAPLGRINAVAPSWTVTPMASDFSNQKQAVLKHLQNVSMKKIATTKDVSSLVYFLSDGDLSGHITGQCIELSGGLEGRIQWEKEQINLNKIF